MAKNKPVKTVNPFLMKGTNPFSGINPFVGSSNIPALKIDTEAHFSVDKAEPVLESPSNFHDTNECTTDKNY